MLIDYKTLVQKHGWNPKGVIHVGGHRGEEQEVYDKLGVEFTIWFEAILESVREMSVIFKDRKNARIIHACLSDKCEYVNFNITNNFASSSILEMGTHKVNHPKIHNVSTKRFFTVPMSKYATVFKESEKKGGFKFDTLNIDVQGAELKVLKGAGDLLKQIKWIYCEVNTDYVYKDCALIDEIDDYLKGYGFERVETYMTPKNWGDAFYVKTRSND